MGKRTNTARWTGKMWRIDVQQDGKRKSFYSSRPGRTGQREANAKADAWLDDGIAARTPKVADAGKGKPFKRNCKSHEHPRRNFPYAGRDTNRPASNFDMVRLGT